MGGDIGSGTAAIVASLIAAAVALLVFAAREAWALRTQRRRAAASLVVYADAVGRALSRNDQLLAPPIDVRDLLEVAGDVMHVPEAAALTAEIELALFHMNEAHVLKSPLDRNERDAILTKLEELGRAHRIRSGLPRPDERPPADASMLG